MSTTLRVCPRCGRHGNFKLSNGRPSRDFASKQGAYTELQELLKYALVTRDELVSMSDEVSRQKKLADQLPQSLRCKLFERSLEFLREKESGTAEIEGGLPKKRGGTGIH